MGALLGPLARWGLPLVAGWLISDVAKSGADAAKAGEGAVDHLTKAAPWIVGGLALWLVAQKGR
ncbi:hypothetical protein OD754_10725 [Rhodobacter capsulatus]|uniref:hypothetical protein n=1 Tax=Rhodobacter capsulatus TaxID=1061 RepID=UPI0028756144|nr:hypothetical protein [Rhodobacter capsulatus]MDS0927297.1 hypothetical protein [Rhodobacter capsulatus]UYE93266.1 hypothetical protein Jorvik_17 [Rhodobacter phage Jorvik]